MTMSVYAKMVMAPQMTTRISPPALVHVMYSYIRIQREREEVGGRVTGGTDEADCDDPVGAVGPDTAAVDDPVEGGDLGEFRLVGGAAETGDALLGRFGGCGGTAGGGGCSREGVGPGCGEAGGICNGAGGGHWCV